MTEIFDKEIFDKFKFNYYRIYVGNVNSILYFFTFLNENDFKKALNHSKYKRRYTSFRKIDKQSFLSKSTFGFIGNNKQLIGNFTIAFMLDDFKISEKEHKECKFLISNDIIDVPNYLNILYRINLSSSYEQYLDSILVDSILL